MRYILKDGMLFREEGKEPIIHMKGVFFGPEKKICLLNGEGVLRTDIYRRSPPPGKQADARFREYVILAPDGRKLVSGKPDYMQEDDPAVVGWPICRMPRVDHAAVTIGERAYALIMHNTRNYALKNKAGYTVVQIMHRGLCGGWNIETDEDFSPGILCGIFFFCRYMEQENEWFPV